MSERYNITTIANDFLKASLLGINSTCKAIEIARGEAEFYFNHITRAINPRIARLPVLLLILIAIV